MSKIYGHTRFGHIIEKYTEFLHACKVLVYINIIGFFMHVEIYYIYMLECKNTDIFTYTATMIYICVSLVYGRHGEVGGRCHTQ